MESANIVGFTQEVKFPSSALQEENRREALSKYTENLYKLGQVFSNPGPDRPDEIPLEMNLATPDYSSKSARQHDLYNEFGRLNQLLREGRTEEALNSSSELIDYESPYLAFLPKFRDKRQESIKKAETLLPWTSKDSIIIIPL